MPADPILAAIEVKNVRHWLYPSAQEIYQLLYKAARLQTENPGVSILPVLVCRRKHFLSLPFSRALGFYIIESRKQYLLPNTTVNPQAVNEVRDELGFEDLTVSDRSDPGLVKVFSEVLPRGALANVERWAQTGPALVDYFQALRGDLSDSERTAIHEELKEAIDDLGIQVQW
jgi:hypothetical protein